MEANMQNTKFHVDSLFNGFEETKNLAEFKEELTGHLNEKIASLVKKGVNEMEAFQKAVTELGDISAIAEEMSLKKKQEIYSDMYMRTRKYITPLRAILFVLGGAIIFFGAVASAITWFTTEMQHAALGAAMVFVTIGAVLLTFMALTQETATKYPMSWKRAIFYAIAVCIFLFGIFVVPLAYFSITLEVQNTAEIAEHGWTNSIQNLGFTAAIGSTIPFILPSAALFVFLVLTEKDRRKPWVK
jgi:riboflavin transporter FmnP